MDEDLPAARLADEISHGFGLLAMVAGAVAGVVVGAAIVAATAATGGAAAVIIAGAVAGGGLAAGQLMSGITTIFELPEVTTGAIAKGSMNVFINDRPAARATLDFAAGCTGLPFNHMPLFAPVFIAEGAQTVYTNDVPQSRLKMKMVCGANIKTSSPNVIIGGPTERTLFVFDLESWFKTGLEWLGMAALVGAGVLAAAAGAAAFLAFAGITAGAMLAFEGLGRLGDMLGPGYRDLFQGVAGLGLLFAGPRMARSQKVQKSPAVQAAQAARDRARVTQLAREGKITEARAVLEPFVRNRDYKGLVDRLDVSTKPGKGSLWSGNKLEAAARARANGADTLETTPGGRVVDDWALLNDSFGGNRKESGAFWGSVSEKYALGLSGDVPVYQTPTRAATGGGDIYKNYELPAIQRTGRANVLPPEIVPEPPPRAVVPPPPPPPPVPPAPPP